MLQFHGPPGLSFSSKRVLFSSVRIVILLSDPGRTEKKLVRSQKITSRLFKISYDRSKDTKLG